MDPVWRKSSRSQGSTDNCVEIAPVEDMIAIRDSKDRQGPKLIFTKSEWDAFVEAIKAGEFDYMA
ncbi:DUF397 domain-containing protein [Nonomuraea sp. CA-143628]|uniref:DUF397 domain-containing protein n=1 Tax=Nonomuraea sp. CA-143628 TaxID=3239997 RepID=UPI003D90E507